LKSAKVFRASLGDLLPTLPSKLDGGGIFLFWQNLEGVASTPDGIMHEQPHATNLPVINLINRVPAAARRCVWRLRQNETAKTA
jgi:hypothetical protein